MRIIKNIIADKISASILIGVELMAEITNKLLKQAIADAEAVRETAIANAKLALEEAITPQVKEMIARRLRVEAEMGEKETEETPELKKDAPEMEEATEKPFEDGEAEGSTEFPADSSTIGTGDNKEPSADAFDSSEMDMSGEAPADSATDWYDDWDEADFDLGEIIKELENDIAALSGSEGETEEAPETEEEPEEAPVAEAKEEKEEKEELKEEKEEEKEEKKKEVKEVAQGSDVHKYTKPEMTNEGEEEGEEKEVDLEEILAELEADEAPVEKKDDKEAMLQKLAGLKNELAQYREAVKVLSGRLQEVNLLNAKLLFTNKMFRKEGLNNDQKVRIVESFDRATTVREVKLVYAALVENLSTQAKAFNASRKKVVAEGLASKPTRSTAPKAEVIVENTVAKRLQQLAGII